MKVPYSGAAIETVGELGVFLGATECWRLVETFAALAMRAMVRSGERVYHPGELCR